FFETCFHMPAVGFSDLNQSCLVLQGRSWQVTFPNLWYGDSRSVLPSLLMRNVRRAVAEGIRICAVAIYAIASAILELDVSCAGRPTVIVGDDECAGLQSWQII